MRPFKPGDSLQDHAAPITDVLQQLSTQLAEFQALKEQLADSGPSHIPGSPLHYGQRPSGSIDSGITSASSSFLHLPSDANRYYDHGRGRH